MNDNLKKRGLFIVFEGIDRSGKSTQINNLKDFLKNKLKIESKIIRFPDRDIQSGKMLDEYLKSMKNMHVKASHLLFSFNRWEKRESIINDLNNGLTIISDRYAFSGAVYSMSLGCDTEFCLNTDKGLPRPDIVFQLDLDPSIVKNRSGYGDEIYEKLDFQTKVRENYKIFQNKKYWRVIDANRDQEAIGNEISSVLENYLENNETQEINEDLFSSDNL